MDPISLTIVAIVLVVATALVAWAIVVKNRRRPGDHVFRASRLSRGNRLLPAQVIITPESITLFKPQWVGKRESSVHLAHVASINIDTDLIFSDIFIETTGGQKPIVYSGHTKGDAVKMKALIERYQSARFARPQAP